MFYISLFISKLSYYFLKLLGRNATMLPGKLAIKIYPNFLNKISKPKFIIGVTGTNGKTTVCNLLTDFYTKNNYKIISNKYGSNINYGIASTFICSTNIFNKNNYDIAVLEIDERSSKKILPYVKLDYLVCTNLFRDSIRRNANAEFIFNLINSNVSSDTKLILNADDLISSELGNKENRKFFSVGNINKSEGGSENIINDVRVCPKCNNKLKYLYSKYNHIGNAVCENCGFESPKSDYIVSEVNYDKKFLTITHDKKKYKYNLISDSMFNIYNIVTVVALLSELGVEQKLISEFFENEKIVQSRYRKDVVKGINLITHMAKGQNSVACSCVFDYVRKEKNNKEIILLLFDLFDSKNSSENITWIYDCDFEFLNDENINKIIIGGPRALDFYLRLLIAGVSKEKLVACTNELDVVDYLSLSKNIDIYLLYELYDYDIADKIRCKIIDRINRGKNEKN